MLRDDLEALLELTGCEPALTATSPLQAVVEAARAMAASTDERAWGLVPLDLAPYAAVARRGRMAPLAQLASAVGVCDLVPLATGLLQDTTLYVDRQPDRWGEHRAYVRDETSLPGLPWFGFRGLDAAVAWMLAVSRDPSVLVVIVGGRPAGASLAARLGAAGRSVLVVDRAGFPSPPGVPSCPILYPQAMALLDEIGLHEDAYADASVKVERFVIEFGAWFDAPFRMIESRGRDYVLGIDRARFDHALWRHLERYPSVTRREGFAVTDLLRDGTGRVIGVEGRVDGEVRRVTADVVVGADGRFSLVARKAGAMITEDRPEHQSTVYWADWAGVAPFRGEAGPMVHIHATGRGTDVLFFPMPDGLTTVCTHQRADRVRTDGDAEAYYLDAIGAYDSVRRRLAGARRVGDVIGMKRVANRYLTHGGPGWVLVGDALHHKDPVDGQGIYDAFLEAKILAEILADALDGRTPWDDAVTDYGRRVLEATRPMFQATMDRLKNELYGEPPVPVIRTMIRWMLNDPEYQDRFLRFLCRDIDPERWLSPGVMGRAAVRGAFGDVRATLRGLWDRPTA